MRVNLMVMVMAMALGSQAQAAESASPVVEPVAGSPKVEQQPLPAIDELPGPVWDDRLEVGAGAGYVSRFAPGAGSNAMRYQDAPALDVHVRWPILSWLRFHAYFLRSVHGVELGSDGLRTDSVASISSDATYGPLSVEVFSFGAKIAPTWSFNSRTRAWLSAGVGWGRFQFATHNITESGASFDVQARSGAFAEFPVGIGVAFDVWPRWLSLSYEAAGAPSVGGSGAAYEPGQAIDADGQVLDVSPMRKTDASFSQILSLSLKL